MNSFAPRMKCKAIIVSCKHYNNFLEIGKRYGIEVIPNPINKKLVGPVSAHPDMSLHPIDRKTLVVDKDMVNYYEKRLSKYSIKILAGKSILGKLYPQDCIFNVGRISNYYIHNDIIDQRLKEYFERVKIEQIYVRQGYSKCSVLNIKYDTIITQDKGIHNAVIKQGLSSYLIKPGAIKIEGYDTGFIGGCGGMIDHKQLLLSGDPATYKYGQDLLAILEENNIDYTYPASDFKDIGSIIPIGE